MRRTISTAAILVSLAAAFFVSFGSTASEDKKSMKTHITIIIDNPLLQTGGTVLVVPRKTSQDLWSRIPSRPRNPLVQNNAKSNELGADDKLLEAKIIKKVSIIEFEYPDNGTYGFNFVASGTGSGFPVLRTKRVLVGSGYYTDQKTGKRVDWDEVSTIHIYGAEVDEAFSRSVRISSNEIMNANPAKITGDGFAVYQLTEEQVDATVVKEPN